MDLDDGVAHHAVIPNDQLEGIEEMLRGFGLGDSNSDISGDFIDRHKLGHHPAIGRGGQHLDIHRENFADFGGRGGGRGGHGLELHFGRKALGAGPVDVNVGFAVRRGERDARDEATVAGKAKFVIAGVAKEVVEGTELMGPSTLLRGVKEFGGRERRVIDRGLREGGRQTARVRVGPLVSYGEVPC